MASKRAKTEEWVRRIDAAARRQQAASSRFDHLVGWQAGLTLSTCEANFVYLLLMHGPMSPGQLGRLAELTSSGTVTGTIDRLEKAGYVQRTRSSQDRRKVTVSLNAEWLAEENAPRTQRLAAVLAGYDEAQLATIADFLERLADVETEATTPLAT